MARNRHPLVGTNASVRTGASRGSVLNRRYNDRIDVSLGLTRRLGLALFTVLCCLWTQVSRAESFGRFGYGAGVGLDSLKVTLRGVQADYPGSARLDFAVPAKGLEAVATHSTAQTCLIDGEAPVPKKVRISLIGNSVDLFFPNGVNLVCTSQDAPFLSWSGHSVGSGVPTDDVKWVLLTFADAEPPLLLGLSGASGSFEVTGNPGAWRLAVPEFSGWLRIWTPFGLEPQSATDAGGLGKIVQQVEGLSDVWAAETPTVTHVSVTANDSSVDATWQFSQEGAFVPPASLMAQLGGSSLEIKSDYRSLPGQDLPRAVVKDRTLKIHFPCERIKPGRALGMGNPPFEPMQSASTIDLPSLVELGNENLVAWGDEDLLKTADSTVTRFLTQCDYFLEPNSRQQLPYAKEGSSLAIAAAESYLAQCSSLAAGSTQPNALFDSLVWRRDWWSWMIWAKDPSISREATALAALAGAMSPNPEARFYGATMEAGLDAQRGRLIWLERRHLSKGAGSLEEPLLGLRTGFFVLSRIRDTSLDFYRLIQSPIKVAPGPPITLLPSDRQYVLQWKIDVAKPASLSVLDPPFDLTASARENIGKLNCLQTRDLFSLDYVPLSIGTCSVSLQLGAASVTIPKEVAPPAL